ncbi:hypothetical protein CR513_12029, partial [Mucuna pruriens]
VSLTIGIICGKWKGSSTMGSNKFDIEKFFGSNDFGLWRIKMQAILIHQGYSPYKSIHKRKKNLIKLGDAAIATIGYEIAYVLLVSNFEIEKD